MNLDLKFVSENTGFCRTYYEYKNPKNNLIYKIVIIHNKNYDEICTASKDGEPNCGLKEGLIVKIGDKKYITKKWTDITILEKYNKFT